MLLLSDNDYRNGKKLIERLSFIKDISPFGTILILRNRTL